VTDLTLPPIPPIHRTEIDGVTTFWMDEPGPPVAGLVFRVGRADEPTPMSGVSHLVEHLALAGLGVQDYDHNGMVDAQWSVFMTGGRGDELITFFDRVVGGLVDPPVDRLLIERRILREEREQRGASIGAAVRWYRYGYAGHGRGLGPADDEIALEWLGPEPVRAWARRWYTRQNAVLWLSGPPPAGLRFDRLPDGEKAPLPGTATTPGVTFPTHLAWDGPGATATFTSPRTAAINMAMSIAQRRAMQRLRFDKGLVYGVEFDYEPIGPTEAHILLGGDCPDDRIEPVVDGLLAIVHDLADEGPTTTELAQDVASHVRMYEDRDGRLSLLAITANEHLWDGPSMTAEQFAEERRAVDPAAAAEAVRDALGTMLVLANRPPVPGLATYPAASAERVTGREYGPSGFHLPGRRPKDRLVSGPDGLTVVLGTGEWLTIRYEDVVSCEHVNDDLRLVLGRDGTKIGIDAKAWKDGQRLIEDVDRSIPQELVACSEHGIGGLPDPQDADASQPA
jgi:zinc protease